MSLITKKSVERSFVNMLDAYKKYSKLEKDGLGRDKVSENYSIASFKMALNYLTFGYMGYMDIDVVHEGFKSLIKEKPFYIDRMIDMLSDFIYLGGSVRKASTGSSAGLCYLVMRDNPGCFKLSCGITATVLKDIMYEDRYKVLGLSLYGLTYCCCWLYNRDGKEGYNGIFRSLYRHVFGSEGLSMKEVYTGLLQNYESLYKK